SMYSWTKRLIALRKRHRAFGRGSLELLRPENRKILAYVRRYESEQILCIANLSRFLQAVELDLSKWKGLVPVELFSSNEMPMIGDNPYFLTLGPHAFYWFAMQPRAAPNILSDGAQAATVLPEVRVVGGWEAALVGGSKERLENVLLGYIPLRRWFAGKARRMKSATISDVISVPGTEGNSYLTSVVIGYAEGDPDTYMLPLAYANPAEAPHILERWPLSAIAWVRNQSPSGPSDRKVRWQGAPHEIGHHQRCHQRSRDRGQLVPDLGGDRLRRGRSRHLHAAARVRESRRGAAHPRALAAVGHRMGAQPEPLRPFGPPPHEWRRGNSRPALRCARTAELRRGHPRRHRAAPPRGRGPGDDGGFDEPRLCTPARP